MTPQKRMECFRLLFDYLALIEHQFLSGIRDWSKAGSLWGMMRGMGGVRKSINQSWLAKGLELGLLCWGFKGVQQEIPREEANRAMHQGNALVNNYIHVTNYLTKTGIKTVPQPPYRRHLAPCDFWLFHKLRNCRMRQLRRWKRQWRRSLTRSHKRTSMGPSRSCWDSTTSALQAEEITSKGTWVSCVYSQ